jgi:hypothetical protein
MWQQYFAGTKKRKKERLFYPKKIGKFVDTQFAKAAGAK